MENPDSARPIDRRLLRISPQDNVGVATTTIEAGQPVMIDGVSILSANRVPTGHKLALVPIAAGEKIIKYGAPIGSATHDVRPGDYVHTHNLKSDYLPTYTLDGSNPYLIEEEKEQT